MGTLLAVALAARWRSWLRAGREIRTKGKANPLCGALQASHAEQTAFCKFPMIEKALDWA